jgi:hypothetical protein
MKLNRVFLSATVAAISAVAISSCAYDSHYSGSSYSSGYRSGYGNGNGYGGRNFTTTYFVHTGSPRWGYDPYARCYYDYSRRSYYDPYLNGYYPVGYRPRCVQAAPHPHGWKSGSKYIAPPSYIQDHKLDNYQHREERYRSLNNNGSRNLQVNTQTLEAESYRDRHSSSGRIPETRNQPFFGSPRADKYSNTSDRSRNTNMKESQNSRRSESRVVEPKQEEPRPSRQNSHERHTSGLDRSEEFNQGRSGRGNESVKLEVMRSSEKRDDHRTKSSESHDERISKRR